ncbi:MAG: D-tyrosyl-tRNA(Tyr) deacylase [Mogibacterium sp.]|nr:D-tyrosyl-tRNA(Tyr) deacylase [Mogibacterium sp.]
MRFVIQNAKYGRVTIDGKVVGEIGRGFVVLIGVSNTDTEAIADRMVEKMVKLRVFQDENGKTNLSLADIGGGLLLISQCTLYANCKKGNRPSFIEAGEPTRANELYEYIIAKAKTLCPTVERGEFGAMMQVELCNDGPFTILLDSDTL